MKYWFWELVCIGQKCFMTGAISIVTPGSPVQLMFATLIMMFYLLAVLKAAPYASATDDRMAVITTLSIVISLFFGLLLLTDCKLSHLLYKSVDLANKKAKFYHMSSRFRDRAQKAEQDKENLTVRFAYD